MTAAGWIRMALCAAGLASPAPLAAQESSPVGIWENAHTKMVVEFSAGGEVTMTGLPPSRFGPCGDNGGNICIQGKGFMCHYRAKYDGASMTLLLFTGRPTKFCPEGVFHPKQG